MTGPAIKRRRFARARAAILFGVFVALFVGLRALNRPEPSYNNQPLSYWMERMADPATATHASSVLNEMGPEALPALIDALRVNPSSASDFIYASAVRVHLAPERNYDAPNIRATAAYLLGQIGPPAASASDALIKALNDPEALVRLRAIRALSQIGEPVLPQLIVALNNPSATVRQGAARSIGGMKTKPRSAIPSLIRALSDPRLSVREAAFQSLTQIGEPAQKSFGAANVPHLVEALTNSPSSAARKFSVRTLGKIGPNAKPAIPALLSAKKTSPELNSDIQEALAAIGPQ
jgi:HEAT repeat protein